MTARRKIESEDEKFKQLIIEFHAGHVTRAEVAKAIHLHSTSIGLKSLLKSLQKIFPDARIIHGETELDINYTCATQPQLQKPKYDLVCLLFDDPDTYDLYNRQFFKNSPVTVIHVGGGRYAILDGHHRVRRFAELTASQKPIKVLLISTDCNELIERFGQEIEQVRQSAGTSDVRKLPIL